MGVLGGIGRNTCEKICKKSQGTLGSSKLRMRPQGVGPGMVEITHRKEAEATSEISNAKGKQFVPSILYNAIGIMEAR